MTMTLLPHASIARSDFSGLVKQRHARHVLQVRRIQTRILVPHVLHATSGSMLPRAERNVKTALQGGMITTYSQPQVVQQLHA